MASHRPYIPVLHCNYREIALVKSLANRIINTGIYNNTDVFENPSVSIDVFKPAVTLFSRFITQAKDNSKMKKIRNAQCKVVFNYIVKLLWYVNHIANHDIFIINKSGFDSNYQPEKLPAPPQPTIIRVTEGKENGTYKVYIARRKNKPDVKRDPKTHQTRITYCVEITTTPDDDKSWRIVVGGTVTTKLIFTSITFLAKNYIRVYGVNAAGKGQPSRPYYFTPQ